MELQVKNATEALAEVRARAATAQERLVAAEAEIKEVSCCFLHCHFASHCLIFQNASQVFASASALSVLPSDLQAFNLR